MRCGAPIEECHVGTHAERVAISNKVSREDQDEFALRSHMNAIAAMDAGRFDAELAPVTVRDAKGRETVVSVDEGPRRDSSIESLARLKPVFPLPEGDDRGDATSGTATAGDVPVSRTVAPRLSWSASGPSSATVSSRLPGSSATRRRTSSRSGSSWPP